ncbi:MAG: ABC transporter permease, partial [Bacteroidales bacterium]|nr:ABC transporter permease [Bacteroidales bacterium]
MIRNFLAAIGEYALFLKTVFRKPEKWKIFWKQLIIESDKLILSSILLVGVISLFIGGVLVIQTASNLENPIIDKMYIGYMVRESLILEFCSTMVALILAGKMGSNIASEIGSMRITEQIDAMEMMGVNSAGFLVLPKIVATTVLSPLLMLLSLALGLLGGWIVVES